MTQDSPEFWEQSAQQFQQTMNENWNNAFQSFQNMDLGQTGVDAAVPATQQPAISFSQEMLKELQQQYLKETTDLWAQGLQSGAQSPDKRFAAEAWGPILWRLFRLHPICSTRVP